MKSVLLFSACILIALTGCPPRHPQAVGSGSTNDSGTTASAHENEPSGNDDKATTTATDENEPSGNDDKATTTATNDVESSGNDDKATTTATDDGESSENGNKATTTATGNDGKPTGKTFAVSGTVMQTREYCGGAAPSREMLDELATPLPYAEMKVHVRKGGANQTGTKVFASATTDQDGKFRFDLPAGTWCVVMDEKGPDAPRDLSGEYVKVDEACYKEWLAKCDQVVEVIDAPVREVKLQFRTRCHLNTISYCASWVGPRPP